MAKEPLFPNPQVKPPVKEDLKPAVAEAGKKEEIKPAAPAVTLKEIELELPITVKDLAVRLQEKPSVVIKMLMGLGVMAGINQSLGEAETEKICLKYGCRVKKAPGKEELVLGAHQQEDRQEDLKSCSAVVTFMGHVDHGKTSLLDAIRKTKVAESEHGGITQHIGAYRVVLPGGEITFLDTPGHEAFTAMRARGARITDIVVLVVAADDGVMPQTQEAIDHARAANVPIIVAINKVDRPQANIDRVKKQLSELGLAAEDWGGKTITVAVSAKTGQGIDDLLEMILLEAQMLELKSNPHRLARGVVIEAKMAQGRGPVVTLLVQNGTLHLNQNIIVGNFYGKVRAMFNDRGVSVVSAGPSLPIEALGISGIPEPGEQFFAIEEEKQAKELAQARLEKERQSQIREVKRISLEDLHAQIVAGKIKDLKLIIKADVQGSLEAIKNTLDKLNVSEIKLNIIHTGVGNINNSDAVLAMASDALVLGFNVTCDELAKETAAKEGLEVKIYNIIYELASDIKAAVEGMLEPKIKKVFLGRAEVRKVFKLSRAGTVAGCFVTKGKFNRSASVSLLRNGQPVFEGKISSLKRFKDDVREVAEGFECGMALAGFDQLLEGDIIEAYEIEKIARKL
ncbi:MAG: translation initiation factor IF-2 [Omnitrophica WOR_2 bacterium RIFCSPLOWO2_12_FULL_51_8]|nr:MAG: translation initiation factor IF-2 [Omnitrophica WOR_2 bacterium RIFCSPLOWO2_12_FULL_51_8]